MTIGLTLRAISSSFAGIQIAHCVIAAVGLWFFLGIALFTFVDQPTRQNVWVLVRGVSTPLLSFGLASLLSAGLRVLAAVLACMACAIRPHLIFVLVCRQLIVVVASLIGLSLILKLASKLFARCYIVKNGNTIMHR